MSEAEDIFQRLLPVKWREVEFPISRTRMSLAHDLVEHKYVGVDGARVEDTGLAPIRFSFTAPLISGLTPGRSERWDKLYPSQFRLLVASFVKKSVGVLQHPEFGEFTCKAERMDIDWDAARRGGADVELSFVETKIANDESSFLDGKSPTALDVAAKKLDSPALKLSLRAIFLKKGLPLPPQLEKPYLEKPSFSLGEFANKIKAVFDAPTLLQRRVGGQIDAIGFHVDRIGRSASAARSALTWPVTQSVERSKAALHDMKQNLLAGSKKIARFTVPADTTLAGVARQIPEAKVGDLVKLNPGLMARAEIVKGTVVRYYAGSRAA